VVGQGKQKVCEQRGVTEDSRESGSVYKVAEGGGNGRGELGQ